MSSIYSKVEALALLDNVTFEVMSEDDRLEVLKFNHKGVSIIIGLTREIAKGHTQKLMAVVCDVYCEDMTKLKSQATYLLIALKKYYENIGYNFAALSADTVIIKGVFYKLKIKELETEPREIVILE